MYRNILITGAGSGLGEGTAIGLAKQGHTVIAAAQSWPQVTALRNKAESLGLSGLRVEKLDLLEPHDTACVVGWEFDVLVNNAGIGVGAKAEEHQTKYVDIQLAVNLRAPILFYRECADMLRAAGAEHRSALVVNLASIAGKSPQAWLSVYSATKAAVAAYTVSMNKEFAKQGVKSVAFAPGFVDTDMTDYVKDRIPAEEMLLPSDLGEALRFLLRVSPQCLIPEIVFQRPGEIV
jgi:NAD(P)-dependent dehydrogenase (short-subunit alcohol dehydrogenase family)